MQKKWMLLFLLVGCSNVKSIKSEQTSIQTARAAEEQVAKPINQFQYNPLNLIINPGKVHFFQIPIQSTNVKFNITCRDEKVEVFQKDNKLMGVILESYFSNLKPFECHIHVDGKKYLFATVTVKYFKYPEERIKVDQKKIELSAPDLERVNREQLMLNKIYTEKSDGPYFMEPFISPLDSYVTSYYGKRRVFNNKKKSQHLGIDFRAQVGVPVPSSNSGKVVYSGDLFFTGYTVILYHGLDIYSVYGHLSKLYVKGGEMVKRGQLLGLSGNSGRVSGPHLHWGVKIRGNYIDGFSLIDETQKLAKK